MALKYQKSKIYIIKNNVNDLVYIGATTQELNIRFNDHIRATRTKKTENYRLYTAIKELGEDNFYISLIENYPCEDVRELREREGHYIREFNSWKPEYGYNKKMETRTKHEYYQDTKEHVKDKVKEYYDKHKDQVDNYKKKHYEENKAHFKQYKHEWYLKNKATHNLKGKERIKCECGADICKGALRFHLTTKRHSDSLKSLTNQQE